MLAEAAKKCLDRAGLLPEDLSKLLVTKFIGDRILPMTAALVQRKLKSQLAFHAVDIDGGITAFLNALDYAVRCFSSTASSDQHILIVSGGTHTAAISKTDPRLAFLFGDGAAALLLAYAMVSAGRLDADELRYQWLNLAGGANVSPGP